jgi:uncharacterized protein (DUF849 family)
LKTAYIFRKFVGGVTDRFGTPTNADLVGRMADLAETFGRPVANPEQTRETLGIG